MPKLSVVIITFNEEKNISRCLKSVEDIADDIVVVDSYSTDKTEEIVRSHSARFIRHPFEGHIEQKNWAITQAKYPHILSLDADEVLSDRLRESIRKVKQNWKYDGYYFNRLTNYCGKWIRHTSWYPARKLRLWDSRKGKWGGINPHDKFRLEKGATKKFLRGDLLHYSYYSVNEHIEQINKFSTIVAQAYFKQNRKAGYFKLVFHPVWRLFRDYFLKMGFLDGFYGLVVSVNSAHETFLKYVKLRNLYKEKEEISRSSICFFNSIVSWGGGEKWHFDVASRMYKKGFNVILVGHPNGELLKKAREASLPCYPMKVSNLSFLNPFRIILIYSMLKKGGVGTLILNLSSDLKVAGIAAKIAGIKNIIYRRGSAIAIRDTLLNRFIYRKIVTQIIANSQETARTILQNNQNLIPSDKINVIFNGLDLGKFDRLPVNPIIRKRDEDIIIGNAGRLSEEKGQMMLVDLALILKRKGYKVKILIAGKGRLRSRILKYAHAMGVDNEINLLGFVKNIRDLNAAIDIFILTSLYEGFGYVLVEAMAERKPVVAFDINSSSEIIDDGVTGLLAEKGNVKHLAEKIELLIKDKALRDRMGNAGRTRVEEIFTFNESAEKVEKLLCKEMRNSS